MVLERTFGEKINGVEYRERIGVYAVIVENNKFAVIKIPKGYFLLGGGLHDNETHEECIKRECLEEAGLDVKVNDFLCRGDSYDWVDILDTHLHLIGYFYLVDIIGKVSEPTEEDHEFTWLDIKECEKKMFLKLQSWAIKEACISGFYI